MEQVETEISKFENEDELEESEEDKKKRYKKGGKKKKKEENVAVEMPVIAKTKAPELEPDMNIPGLKNVKLTSLTQKIMGCIVGEHVTAEAPWTTISKVVVDENLYLHHESSDFLPVKEELAEYNDSTILVGYDPNYMPYDDEDFHRFFIAVTEEAKNKVLLALEEEKRLAEERLKNSITKKVLPWQSLGSETEVDESTAKNTRPLIQLELETDIDELLKPVHFQDRNVDDAKDGYVRIGPGRKEFSGVEKLRINASVQAVPALVADSAQTDPGLPKNAWTQYLYDMETAKEDLEKCETKELKSDHVFPEQEYLEKSLEYNENFDLYVNDYPLLVLKESDKEVPHKSVFEEYEAYTDVSHCKNKLISSIAWHPMWSGIVALAYAVGVRCVTSSDIDLTGDEVYRDVFSKNSVLLWSFKDALKPRLILESPREVHSLAWSPIDPNILVGGCASGQIIIWDLKGKLEAVEGHEYLTTDQQRYRLVMQSLIGWLQPQPPAQYVRPVALSCLQFSHSGKVTHIQWIPPHFEWTDDGHYVRISVEEGETSMQLISSGEDGKLLVWDLKRVPDESLGAGRPRKKKARKRPSGLTAQMSPFKSYDRKMCPIYLLYPELPSDRVGIKLSALSIQTFPIKYCLESVYIQTPVQSKSDVEGTESKIVDKHQKSSISLPSKEGILTDEMLSDEMMSEGNENPYTPKEARELETKSTKQEMNDLGSVQDASSDKEKSENSFEMDLDDSLTSRKIYKPMLIPPEKQPLQLIQVTTDEGDCVMMRWEGFDFHKGELITSEQCSVMSWSASVHDGPVVTCARSPFLEDLILTVGGRVTALWKRELRDQPLFWKYSSVGVTCGSWSPYRPCLFHVGRNDGSIEVWDLSKSSDFPSLVQSISGKVLTSMSEHSLPLSDGVSILGVADFNNSFRLLYFPEEYKTPKPDELETLKEFVEREISLRQTYILWNESFTKSNAEELAKMREKEEETERKLKEAELAAEQEAQLRAKLEEEEAKRLAKSRPGGTLTDGFLERLRQEREKQMQRVLMEKKRLNKSELVAKQQPILAMKQMEKGKRKKQREKIRQQQKIFDKTVAMLFPEVMEKPKEDPSKLDEFEAELMKREPELMAHYDRLLPVQLKFIKDNPFNKRLRWEKVFEEGMFRRNILDFPLYLRQQRKERFRKLAAQDGTTAGEGKKGKVGFIDVSSELGGTLGEGEKDEEEEGEEEEEGREGGEEEREEEEEKENEDNQEVEEELGRDGNVEGTDHPGD